jgi:hypothetical protein
MVKVHVGECQPPVVEGNCVAVRRGGEQPETPTIAMIKKVSAGLGGAIWLSSVDLDNYPPRNSNGLADLT